MCVIIHKKIDKVLTLRQIEAAWNRNSDGAGFCYFEEDRWHIVKGLMTLKDFLKAYEPHEKQECFIHFRIGTHGAVTADNTHPFFTKNGLIMFHNGIISGFGSKTYSDSKDFFYNIVAKLGRDYRSRAITSLGGASNKFLLIHENQRYLKFGHWYEKEDYDCTNLSWEPWDNVTGYGGGRHTNGTGVTAQSATERELSSAYGEGYRRTFPHENANGPLRLIGGETVPPYSPVTGSAYQRYLLGEIDWINGREVPKRVSQVLPRIAYTAEQLQAQLQENRAKRAAGERVKNGTTLRMTGGEPIRIEYVEGESVDEHNARVSEVCKAFFAKDKPESKTESQLTSEHLAEQTPYLS